MGKLSDLANEFFELKTQKDELNVELKVISEKMTSLESEMLEEMGHEGMSRIDLQDKASFHITNKRFFKISDRDAFVDFLHEMGHEDMLTVPHQSLNAYVKEMIARKDAEGNEDFEVPGVVFTTKTKIRVKKTN